MRDIAGVTYSLVRRTTDRCGAGLILRNRNGAGASAPAPFSGRSGVESTSGQSCAGPRNHRTAPHRPIRVPSPRSPSASDPRMPGR
jgi:hypothetical protein